MTEQRTLTILGSTGSIGKSTIDVVRDNKSLFEVFALIANTNVELLSSQAREMDAKVVVIGDDSKYQELKSLLADTNIDVRAGFSAIAELSSHKVDLYVSAVVGSAGLSPTINAIKAGSNIALANKESLVCAGGFIMSLVAENNVNIFPIDSEHNAILQCLAGSKSKDINHITLTASGGSFRGYTKEKLAMVTPEQALNHPNWVMGSKITIDSATLMNKGFEFIEAYHLFAIAKDKIKVIIHPQSIIHGAVCFCDGTTLAHMGHPDMRVAISYILGLGDRLKNSANLMFFQDFDKLEFFQPDYENFPLLKLAIDIADKGAAVGTVINASNEVAVEAFLRGRIGFLKIANLVFEMYNKFEDVVVNNIEDVLSLDALVRAKAKEFLEGSY